MKIGVICPDRGDRPRFLQNFKRMLNYQTLQPDEVMIVDFPPTDDNYDITKRYRIGYEEMSKRGVDLIAFMENDDWYSCNYLEEMVLQWHRNYQPDIFGTNYTIYFHLKLNAYFTMNHKLRSSAMSTLIKPNLEFEWCKDSEVYTDIHLWYNIPKKLTFKPEKHICLGMKHGVGKFGGRNHVDRMNRYVNKDGLALLKETMDKESFDFYTNYFNETV